MQLRAYQQQVVKATHACIAQYSSAQLGGWILIVAGTGAGKTVIAAQLIADFLAQGKRVLFIVDVAVLVSQTAEKVKAFGITPGFIKAGYRENSTTPLQVASIQTMSKRSGWQQDRFDIVIWDEAHTSAFADISATIQKTFARSVHIGLTATPLADSLAETAPSICSFVTLGESSFPSTSCFPRKENGAGVEEKTKRSGMRRSLGFWSYSPS